MSRQQITVSIVIPVYNEESQLAACLDAIAVQTVAPLEVIVVDNNSTDQSMAIAQHYPFVRVVRESRHGKAFARSTGFDNAKGDIIGRIDADSVMERNWVKRVEYAFADPSLDTITGLGYTCTMHRLGWPRTTLWSNVYFWNSRVYFKTNVLWGANMALRRRLWPLIREEACMDDTRVHEDTDIALLLAARGHIIKQDKELRITTNGQSYGYLPKLCRYLVLQYRTKQRHIALGTYNKLLPNHSGQLKIIVQGLVVAPLDLLFLVFTILWWPFDVLVMRSSARRASKWLQ